jgi:hypothetical protein
MKFVVPVLQSYVSIKESVPSHYFNMLKIRIGCSAYGGEERRIQWFGGETSGKRLLGRPRSRWEDNIKMVLQEVEWKAWTGSSWLRIGAGGG